MFKMSVHNFFNCCYYDGTGTTHNQNELLIFSLTDGQHKK
jgi:hypothetical protein